MAPYAKRHGKEGHPDHHIPGKLFRPAEGGPEDIPEENAQKNGDSHDDGKDKHRHFDEAFQSRTCDFR
jgi:hypothetical protein